MNSKEIVIEESSKNHFAKRAKKYNRSSQWVDDDLLISKIHEMAQADSDSFVLDIAIGTGKISEAFYKRVKHVVGLDISRDMLKQGSACADTVILSPAETMPFKNNVFDICVCRQGLQFMDVDKAIRQVHRTLKPGGRVVFCHLTAYGESDKDTAFSIQRLRNPARRNFFLPEYFPHLLKKNNFTNIECLEYITRESVGQWIDNGAIDRERMEKIKQEYKNALDGFKKIHHIHTQDGDILDSMKMLVVKGTKI